ncbi:hypothetical protein AB0O28_17175 [Microbispora sp. NPDC088329]|uniref:hypothetical protein n=1 Tax=Microbispora sp. NPDC088329 TaxID=3154869 RepID=UPI003439840A
MGCPYAPGTGRRVRPRADVSLRRRAQARPEAGEETGDEPGDASPAGAKTPEQALAEGSVASGDPALLHRFVEAVRF